MIQIVANSVAFVNIYILVKYILFQAIADMSGKKVLFLLMTLVAVSHSYVAIIDCTGREGQV